MHKQRIDRDNKTHPAAFQSSSFADYNSDGAKSKPPAIQLVSTSVNLMNQPMQMKEDVLQQQEADNKVYGKHRARVLNTTDPLQEKRLQVEIPSVHGNTPMWAVCGNSIYTGPNGDDFPLPEVEANIFVEFEAGDPQYPIWF